MQQEVPPARRITEMQDQRRLKENPMPKKILVIDDEPMVIRMVESALTARGFTVVSAPNGYEGLIAARNQKPDLILLDVVMPDLDGHEVARRLRKDERTKSIPIIHLSAVGDFDKQLQAMEDGSMDYITKPIKPSELADRVETFLDPNKRASVDRDAHVKTGRLRAITDIMHRDHDA
jgi:two-component system, OmpR family, alkaline phosphatase synthesis response regulator PhoP